MLSNHLILCHPRLLLSSVFPLQDVSYKRVISTWFSKILLCLLFLKNNQPEIILMPDRHTLGLESLLPFQGHILGLGRWKGGAGGKEPSANTGDAGDEGSVLGAGRSPGGGLGTPLQYSCLGNPVDRGAWQILWTEERGRLQSMGSQRVGHDWVPEHARTDSLGYPGLPSCCLLPCLIASGRSWFWLT